MQLWIAILALFSVAPSWSAQIGDVSLPEEIQVEGKALQLNGAGVRTKFFFDIYVGALYLPRPTTQARQAIEGPDPKRVSMHFLYSEVDRKKLVNGWKEGFEKNQDRAALEKLRERLRRFNSLFGDAHEGDLLLFNFLTDGSTEIILNGENKGRIEGKDFQQALLAVWLGREPADKGLRKAMLKGSA